MGWTNLTPTKNKMSKLKAKPPEETSPGKLKAMLYGTFGAGKSWAALGFPAPFYFDTEGGADLAHYQKKLKAAGGGYLGPKDGTQNAEFLIEQIKALATERHGYKTLIVDSITKLYQTIIANEQERLQSVNQPDAFGASKKPAVRFMRQLVNWVGKLDMNVWFIAHETTEWGLDANGNRTEIGKAADCWDKLPYELHLALWVQKRGTTARVAIVKKTRLLGFPEGSSVPLQSNGEDVSYSEIAARYGKDFIEAEVKQFEPATPEQVAEIVHLVGVLKTTPEEISKILTKAQADEWSELNTEQAAKTIQWLNAKITTK